MAALQLYRQSAVGDTLSDALHEMVGEDKISGDLATKVMAEVAFLVSNLLHYTCPCFFSTAFLHACQSGPPYCPIMLPVRVAACCGHRPVACMTDMLAL